ncbi:MAG: GNAT family N-acetyltransferase [Planctomycetaceae bacterium]|nr:GNAT family N-acetyltransferase [Planctomycetaceae bacterium]
MRPDDAAAYRALRLEALQQHPTAYVTAYEEDAALTAEQLHKRLTPSEEALTFGALDGDRLVGIGTLVRPERIRLSFRAMIVGMYVTASHRRTGLASRLVKTCIDRARSLTGVEEVCLCVTVGNDAARRTYLACGFLPEYVELRYFKYEGRYYDIEWLRLPLV